MSKNSTIYALSSGAGKAGVAIIRLSGPEAFAIARLVGGHPDRLREACYCVFRDASGRLIDRGMAISFAGPNSFNGEDIVEFHIHGARAVITALGDALEQAGALPAGPGAFTRRAFENGKLDLSQTEALADLIEAETEAQRRQALGQLGGNLSELVATWRAGLIKALGAIEAAIDFGDEGDVPDEASAAALPVIADILAEMQRLIEAAPKARQRRDGVRIVLFGPPNSGKSSLLNALAGTERAIVSEQAGTTRDTIDVHLNLAGVPCILTDTAGLRAVAVDDIEAEGMRRTAAIHAQADLKILVEPVPTDQSPGDSREWSTLVSRRLADYDKTAPDLLLWNKVDVLETKARAQLIRSIAGRFEGIEALAVSAKTEENLEALLAWLTAHMEAVAKNPDTVALTRERHVEEITRASAALRRGVPVLSDRPELAAEELRLAATALDRITGKIDVEDVLGEIFANFCIGK